MKYEYRFSVNEYRFSVNVYNEEAQNYPIVFQKYLTISSILPNRLTMNIGDILMLHRNLSIAQRLYREIYKKVLQRYKNSI